ncbi:hypothetical protein BJY24_001982 [Nocardia transvalensis]|uniref:Uncharacterized protein n=1 Tax=Nocardia transvalensis TaxID=37333 RepID=A0A7W9PBR8_9NOCA|nr:hypothetical protein [Nocardia transvalensis]MBB5913115.1 hypothetical protein [Nocardia transvalensis]
MTEIRYIAVPPRRFRLNRTDGTVVETTLIGLWRRVPASGAGRDNEIIGCKVRLGDGMEVPLDQLMNEWGETTLGTPDLHD